MLKSRDLIILSSLKGKPLGRHTPPQAATARQPSGPARHRLPQAGRGSATGCHRVPQAGRGSYPESSKSPQIGAPARTGVPNSSLGHPGYSSGAQMAPGPCSKTPEVFKAFQNVTQNRSESSTRQAKRQSSKHPSIHSSGPRGRRQRR